MDGVAPANCGLDGNGLDGNVVLGYYEIMDINKASRRLQIGGMRAGR